MFKDYKKIILIAAVSVFVIFVVSITTFLIISNLTDADNIVKPDKQATAAKLEQKAAQSITDKDMEAAVRYYKSAIDEYKKNDNEQKVSEIKTIITIINSPGPPTEPTEQIVKTGQRVD